MIQRYSRLFFLAAGLLMILAACSSNPSPPETATAVVETAIPVPPTQTSSPAPAPTVTAAPTLAPTGLPAPTAAPSRTPLPPLAIAEDGFQVWCLPVDAPAASQVSVKVPANARVGAYSDLFEAYQVVIPASSCTLAYTFNQPLTQDVQLEAYYSIGTTPWLKTTLSPVQDNPMVGFVTLTQPYVLDPPFWQVDYQFVVRVAGQEARSDRVSFYKVVERCWEGSLPDPVTLACPAADVREPEPKPGVTPSSPDYRK